jgi:hypothetical protein
MRVYRMLLTLYPRPFRREYADDMVALLEAQLREEHAVRIIGRTSIDLLVSIPLTHLETHMPRSSATPLIIAFVAVAGAAAVFGGPVGLLAAVALLTVAGLLVQHQRPVAVTSTTRWWKLLLSGVLLLGTLVAVTTATGELPSGGWYIAMATLFISFGLIGTGVVLGLAGRLRTH